MFLLRRTLSLLSNPSVLCATLLLLWMAMGAGRRAAIFLVYPIGTVVLAGVVLRERLTLLQLVGIVLAFTASVGLALV